jgi:hypothetical protein
MSVFYTFGLKRSFLNNNLFLSWGFGKVTNLEVYLRRMYEFTREQGG